MNSRRASTTALTLDELVRDPARALTVSTSEAAQLLAAAEGIAALLRRRVDAVMPSATSEPERPIADRLLTAEQVGERLGLSVEQVYRRASRWPFTRREGRRTLRFSESGLARHLNEQDE